MILAPARPEDSAAVARLWADAFGETLGFILGDQHRPFLEIWLAQDPGLFDNTTLAMLDGKAIGYIQSEMLERKRRVQVGVLCRLLFRWFGPTGGAKRLLQFWITEWGRRYEKEDLYIFMIGVDASSRGRGVGRLLLQHAEKEARRLGKRRLRLGVIENNHAARRLYQSAGFRTLYRGRNPFLRWAEGVSGYEVMVKPLCVQRHEYGWRTPSEFAAISKNNNEIFEKKDVNDTKNNKDDKDNSNSRDSEDCK